MLAKPPTHTRWGAAFALIAAGVAAALQVGKAAIALPALQGDLHLTLGAAAWIVGAYGFVGSALGLPIGIASSVFRARQTILAGLIAAGIGSLAGGVAPDGGTLVAARVLEGCGLLISAVAIPRALRLLVAPQDTGTVMTFWSTYLPTGVAAMMLLGPLVLESGWRPLWFSNGILDLAAAFGIAFVRIDEPLETRADSNIWHDLGRVLRKSSAWILGLLFGIYTFQSMAMYGLLPTLFVSRMGLSVSTAGILTAVVVLANAVGNASAGAMLRLKVPTWVSMTCGFACTGATAFGIFMNDMPVSGVALLACANLGISGLIPGSIFATAARLASSSASMAIILGLINQAANVGNLTGPGAMAFVVERFGWQQTSWLFATVAVAGIVLALALRVTLSKTARPDNALG